MPFDPSQPTALLFAAVAVVGLVGGLVGGLAGLGGSIIMLPGLALVLGFSGEEHAEQHLYMAASMVANVAVAVPATLRHKRAGVIPGRLAVRLLPSVLLSVAVGVYLSNRLDGVVLTRLLGGMVLVFVVLVFVRERLSPEADGKDTNTAGLDVSGVATGLSAGLLGVGGGVVLVTALRALARLPIRTAIGLSSTVMIATASLGATLKMMSLGSLGLSAGEGLRIAAALAPGATVGAMVGSSLVHRLPTARVRLIVSLIMVLAAVKLLSA
ncbi:MAG: sulfite exporter TauE/SafE family protein [Planctomycetota bacterium]